MQQVPSGPGNADARPGTVVGDEGNQNDVWFSDDGGVHWKELENTPWPQRHAASIAVHNGALYIGLGNTDWHGGPKLNGKVGCRADVWALKATV